jgi:two-component system cell cycle sensor histidine kinase/response regulator CckA
MTDNGRPEGLEGSGPAAIERRAVPVSSIVLAFLLAAAVAAGAYALKQDVKPFYLVLGAVLSLAGLLAVFGAAAGLVTIGRSSQQREFLDSLTDALAEPCVVADHKGRAVYANGPFIKLAAKAGAGRLVGFDVLYAGYPDFAQPVYQLAQAAREGQAASREIRVAAGSSAPGADPDKPAWLRLSVAPMPQPRGHPYVLWRLSNISDDRARQEQAFSRLQFIITYLDFAPAGFFSARPDGKVDYLNATLAGWLGRDVSQSQNGNLTVTDILGEENTTLIAGVAAQPGSTRTETFDFDLKLKDGTLMPVHVVHRADYDPKGGVLPTRTLILPRQAAAQAELGARPMARFTAAAPIGIADVDRDGLVLTANPAFLKLVPRAKRGAKLAEAVSGEDRNVLAQALADAFAGEMRPATAEASIEGDKNRAVQFTFVRLSGADNAAVAFAMDRTEKRELEVQLVQGQKMQAVGQLASGIAHDFNNVLTPIIGFADLLLAKMRPTDPSFADVMNIKQNANRAANLVRQLLAFSRRQTLQPKVHSLTETMSDLGNLLGRSLGEKVELKIIHGRDLGLVMVDIHQFEQVIINLAVNARDAMPNGGKLKFTTYNLSAEDSKSVRPDLMPPGEYVVVEVEDEGTGIPPEILDKIWEPFFSTKEVGKGTGLGLSTVYGIVKQTGGYIFCDSVVGRGTKFSIYLPRYYPPADAAPQEEAKPVQPKRADLTGKGRILLVEDEDAVRAFALRALSSRGYTVVEADSGERAIEIIEADKDGFDLILSDVVMPELDGPSMLREIRKRGIKTKVIFVSGYAEDAFEKNLEGETDFAFLPKPFSLKQLVEKVKEVMES